MWPHASLDEIKAAIPRHSIGSCSKMAEKLGIRRPKHPGSKNPIFQALKQLREDKGIKRTDLAERLGYHWMLLGRWERGEAAPSIQRIMDWAEALDAEIVLVPRVAPASSDERIGARIPQSAKRLMDEQKQRDPHVVARLCSRLTSAAFDIEADWWADRHSKSVDRRMARKFFWTLFCVEFGFPAPTAREFFDRDTRDVRADLEDIDALRDEDTETGRAFDILMNQIGHLAVGFAEATERLPAKLKHLHRKAQRNKGTAA